MPWNVGSAPWDSGLHPHRDSPDLEYCLPARLRVHLHCVVVTGCFNSIAEGTAIVSTQPISPQFFFHPFAFLCLRPSPALSHCSFWLHLLCRYNTVGLPVAAGVLFPVFKVTLPPTLAASAMVRSVGHLKGNKTIHNPLSRPKYPHPDPL